MNLNIKNRQQLLTVIALLAVAVWLGDRLVLTPLITGWRSRSAKIADLRKSVVQGRQLLERERATRERWASMQANMLPAETSEAEGRILRAFDQWSLESRITVTAITPQWKQADEYKTLEYRVDGYGSLSAITRFLYALERDPMALKIESLELSARNNEGSELTLGLLVSGLQLVASEP
jgi:hypothetical protein